MRTKKGTNIISHEVPGWPKWLVDRLGVDAFGSITEVSLLGRSPVRPSPEEIEEAFAQIGHLSRLKRLSLMRSAAD